jgi:hypothetical protein
VARLRGNFELELLRAFSSRLVEKMVDDEIKQSFSGPSASKIFSLRGKEPESLNNEGCVGRL